jgi:hypothetical protein
MKWQRRHEGVLLYVLRNPAAKQYEIARQTGYSKWHVCRIMRSPEFEARLRPVLDAAVVDMILQRLGDPNESHPPSEEDD